jgi:pyruvate-formate lyase-activating enzyme
MKKKRKQSGRSRRRSEPVRAVVADAAGEIFDLDGYVAVGRCGPLLAPLSTVDTIPMPQGGELMYLPDRRPVVYNMTTGMIETLMENPFAPGEPVHPVAAFNSPGYVLTAVSAYDEMPAAGPLPLFSYGAVGWQGDGFRSALVRVDTEPRQDLRRMPVDRVRAGVRQMQKRLPDNRLRAHLEKCALTYGCPAGKNFFLGRYEAPLPTSRSCNARCLGCISLQADDSLRCSQDRIAFTPTPEEIAGVALTHIGRVGRAVVSFGQGCEGDPLLAADAIAPAIARIRSETGNGTINVNTNGSLPGVLSNLFDAGLDSIRVSLNSVRRACYNAYFRPAGYRFEDVMDSIALALDRGKFVAINYLNMPGFTDTPEEFEALDRFLTTHPIGMIQWRNLNFDPLRYLGAMNEVADHGPSMGLKKLLARIHKSHPRLIFGYFNPPKEKWPGR